MSAILKERVRYLPLLSKLRKPEECVEFFKNGQYIGWSGFAGVGAPKKVPEALSKHVEDNKLQGKLAFNLFVGASAGPEESKWAENGMILRRSPHQVGRGIANSINTGGTHFFDKHLSMFAQDLTYGYYTRFKKDNDLLDYSIIEVTAITENGGLILGPGVGAVPEIVSVSDKLILEVNTKNPSFEGLHDIDMPINPHSDQLILIAEVAAIVECDRSDAIPPNTPSDAMSQAIGNHLIEFFEQEVKAGRMPSNLHPLQSGIGNIANAVIDGLSSSSFKDLKVWTEVLQDSFLDFFEKGTLDYATASAIRLTENGFKRFFDNWDLFSKKLCLRSQVVSNSPEIIRRLGVIAMNTPVEVDIYAHANSTNVNGSKMLHGIGGSGDFLRNAKLSIMHTPSARKTKTDPTGISCIVPFASHIDQTEHDLDILVTEQGLADLRGLSPRERSVEIIKNCAHPDYKDQLLDYVRRAELQAAKTKSLHEPHILADALITALRFEVPAGSSKKCIRDFISEGQLVVVNIESSGQVGDGQQLNFNIVDSVGNEYRRKKDFAGSTRVAFTAHASAAFDVCFQNLLLRSNNRAKNQFREIELDIEAGSAARDWNAIQAAEKLKPVELELRRIEELTDEIVDELNYLKVREERLRNTNESTNSRVKNFSFLIIISLISLGIWQVQYLRAYFRSKHII
ncbi:uncharacterized protein ASCRUDRAFT_10121 [Ascoidea rubescens DSM 1968]|uniref:Acetyl-CoA hydrolase n=1 Tax=Ascoidea rubescens DSM 1968 TaxID=1344418 RepID=A0A1D2VAR6_9ASCO|nr:hypothetical protein ASCRUDRAFT_10121 [Ascoidea rubescens DSM 1968]ODV58527.1 hypothetical protein ASCRUDRAFT_10121 [Ascoidea rubescens DSM 1968]